MKKFIIIGRGLAASCLMHQFHEHGIDFICIGEPSLSASSKVAGGIWNPVVFKRMTASWMADDLIPSLLDFYAKCQKRLNTALITQRSILKPFTENQEKQLWLKKATNALDNYLDTTLYDPRPEHHSLHINNQYGKVQQAGNLNMEVFLEATRLYFKHNIVQEIVDYNDIKVHPDCVEYKTHQAEHIIFCEGYLVKNNPYFDWIPLVPAKGETLTVKGFGLNLKQFIFNKDGFIMDLGNDHYKIGATYEWKDLNDQITAKGLQDLENKIRQMTSASYQVLSQEAGVRPSSIDRRPIVGKHPVHSHLHVFNGLGAKGVMLAPYFTENFVYFYLQKQHLHQEVDVKRFYHLYGSSTKK